MSTCLAFCHENTAATDVRIERVSGAIKAEGFLNAEGIPVLCYHQVVTEQMYRKKPTAYAVTINQFKEQMNLLYSAGYRTVTLREFMNFIAGSGKPARLGRNKGVLITFDDGNNDFENYALPVLNQHGFKSVLFIYPTYLMARPRKKRATSFKILRSLMKHGHEVQSHALWHPILSSMSFREQESQLRKSKAILEKYTDSTITFLAYPFGLFNRDTFSVLKQEGYEGAFTTFRGENLPGENPFTLRRYLVVKNETLKQFQRYLTDKTLPVQNLSPEEASIPGPDLSISLLLPTGLKSDNLSVRIYSQRPKFAYNMQSGLLTIRGKKPTGKKITVIEITYKENKQTYRREILYNNYPVRGKSGKRVRKI